MIGSGSGEVSAEQKQVSIQVSSIDFGHVIVFIEQEMMLFPSLGQEQAQAWVQKETEVAGSHFTMDASFELMMVLRRKANIR
jgi:hypothetical protein